MYVIKISPDGRHIDAQAVAGEVGWREMAEMIGCEHINLADFAEKEMQKYIMVVDDEGLLRNTVKVNSLASVMYGVFDHGCKLVGNVLIMKNEYAEDGGIDTVPLTIGEVGEVMGYIFSLGDRYGALRSKVEAQKAK